MKSAANHPFYTFLPAQHSPLKTAVVQTLVDFFIQIQQFLRGKNAYANLLLDDVSLPLVSTYFSLQNLQNFRFLTAENVHSNREKQTDIFAVYFCAFTDKNVKRIADDFGGAPIISLQEVKKIRQQTKCCMQENRFFNPYSYRGLFTIFLNGTMQKIQQALTATKLSTIIAKYTVIPLNCSVNGRFANFCMPKPLEDSLSNNGYSEIIANKLLQFFTNIRIKPFVRYQKNSKLAGDIFQRLQLQSGDENAQLLIVERSIDPTALLALPGQLNALLLELLHGETEAIIKYDKAEQKNFEEKVTLKPQCVQEIGTFTVTNGLNAIYKAFNDFKGLKNGQEQFTQDHQVIKVQKLSQTEQLLLQQRIISLNDTLWNLFKCAKYIDNRLQTIKLIEKAQNAIFIAGITGEIKELLKSDLMPQKSLFNCLIEAQEIMPFEAQKVLIFLSVIIQNQRGVLSKEAEAILAKMNECDFFGENNKAFKMLTIFSKLQPPIGEKVVKFINQYCEKRYYSVLELIGLSFLKNQNIDNEFFQPAYQLSFSPLLTKSSWDEGRELQVGKSREIQDDCEIQQQFDQQQFTNKYKIFFYVAGGVTTGEIASLQNLMEDNWGKIGVFNKGIEKEWDIDFYIISDGLLEGDNAFQEIYNGMK